MRNPARPRTAHLASFVLFALLPREGLAQTVTQTVYRGVPVVTPVPAALNASVSGAGSSLPQAPAWGGGLSALPRVDAPALNAPAARPRTDAVAIRPEAHAGPTLRPRSQAPLPEALPADALRGHDRSLLLPAGPARMGPVSPQPAADPGQAVARPSRAPSGKASRSGVARAVAKLAAGLRGDESSRGPIRPEALAAYFDGGASPIALPVLHDAMAASPKRTDPRVKRLLYLNTGISQRVFGAYAAKVADSSKARLESLRSQLRRAQDAHMRLWTSGLDENSGHFRTLNREVKTQIADIRTAQAQTQAVHEAASFLSGFEDRESLIAARDDLKDSLGPGKAGGVYAGFAELAKEIVANPDLTIPVRTFLYDVRPWPRRPLRR